jgi:hypothetical protein
MYNKWWEQEISTEFQMRHEGGQSTSETAHILKDIIKTDCKHMCCEGMNLIKLYQIELWGFLNTIMEVQFS